MTSRNTTWFHRFTTHTLTLASRTCAVILFVFAGILALAPQGHAFDATVLLGEASTEGGIDSNPTGKAQAFQSTATASGAVTALSLYLDGTSTATKVVVGIYSNRNNHPYQLLGQGIISSPHAGGWNQVPVSTINVTSRTRYWIAVLSTSSGKLEIRDRAQNSACSSEGSAQTNLTTLPLTWKTNEIWGSCPVSAAGLGGVVTPVAPVITAGTLSLPANTSFSTVTVNTSSTIPLTVQNTGTGSVIISSATATGAGFSISPLTLPLTLTAGQSASFNAIFAPTVAGSVTGKITLLSNATNASVSDNLSGTGAAPSTPNPPPPTAGTLTLPASTSFPSVEINTSTMLPLIVKNTGTASVTISGAAVTPASFSISGLTLPLTLAAGQSSSFNVTFAPTVAGNVTGSVKLTSNATNSSLSGSLSGTGVNSHLVSLTWSPSSSAGIVGYNVYRGNVPGGPYAKMNNSAASTTSYSDNTIQSGQTYYYVTTAVDDKNNESVYSNESHAGVPMP